MFGEGRMQEGNALRELQKELHENKLAHAFLLETNHPDFCFQNILLFLKHLNCPSSYHEDCRDCSLCHLIDSSNLPSLVVIEPDGMTIKKEQILLLKSFFQTKPIYSKYNMYIVRNAECLNSSSANTMLKFLEEPEEGIIGFFITNNKENVIDTIRSRCQILKDYYEDEQNLSIPSDWYEIAIRYLNELENHKCSALIYNKDVLMPLIHDRKELYYLFYHLLDICHKCYQKKLRNEPFVEEDLLFLEKKDTICFQKLLSLVTDLLEKMNYNVNISLILDCFVLKGSEIL